MNSVLTENSIGSSDRLPQFDKNFISRLSVCLLKAYGIISKPFGFPELARVSAMLTAPVSAKHKCTVRLSDDAQFGFYLADPYWNKLICNGFFYEPEINRMLERLSDIQYDFWDLGANHGYWSVLASSAYYGANNTIAVEPVQSNFDMLMQNRELNSNRFEIFHRAISDTTNQTINLNVDPHSLSNVAASINAPITFKEGIVETVSTMTIDDLLLSQDRHSELIVIKVDVEGVEIAALKGATKTLKKDVLLIYEDHGNEPNCEVSQYILDLGMEVYHGEDGHFTRVQTINDVKRIKTRPGKGYNLFAFHSDSIVNDRINRKVN